MKLAGIRAMLPIAFAALALAASGCDKAKSLAEEAAGFSLLDNSERDKILAEAGWDTTKNPGLAAFKIHKAFEVTDKFPGDFSKDAEFNIPLDTPSQAQGAADKQRSALLVRKETFNTGDAQYTRLRIITVARIDSAASKIVIEGEKINQYIPANKIVSKAANNQAGTYILIEGEKVALAFLTGDVKFIADGKADADAVAVPGETLVFTSSSPFVTTAGDDTSGGKYFLAMLEGSTGTVFGYNATIGTTYTGTPTTVTKEMAYSGVLDQYKGAVSEKSGKIGGEAQTKALAGFDKANKIVTDFVNGWKLVVTDLRFKQPPQAKPTPAAPPTPSPAQPTEPTTDKPADVPPETGSPVVRKPPGEVIYNVDLGCNGFDDAGAELAILRDGSKFDNYEAAKGWRATGTAGISYELAEKIFPSDTATVGERYLDGVPGYCFIATGDQLYAISKTTIDLPGPDGAGQVSELWQKVNIPTDAKSIQMRVAFFSSEFPVYVGTQFNDSFFAKFDESTDLLAFGSLNDLAGGTDAAAGCSSSNGSYTAGGKCGEWIWAKDGIGHGDLWDVRNSSQTPGDGSTMGCIDADNDTGTAGKCYHGMIPSRIICKDLNTQDVGKIRTLRFQVADAGDAYYDSALAIDSVVFSTAACSDPAGRMTPEADSKARTVN